MTSVDLDGFPVAKLRRYAALFDEISDETGARYSAEAFVAWVERELDGRRAEPAGRPYRKVNGVARQQPALSASVQSP